MSETNRTVIDVWGMEKIFPYKPSKSPASTTNDDLICGVELEIENLPLGLRTYQITSGGSWSVVEDGSLRPRGAAWEFVSQPMPLSHIIPEIEGLFQRLGLDERRNYSDRCSVHVHTNVQDFTQEQLASLATLYPVFEEVLFHYVNHFKALEEQGYCRDTNIYCIPWSSCRMNRKFVSSLFATPSTIRHNWQKYTALNLLPISEKGTVEWRHMHGTQDMEKLTTWLNLIGAIMKYAKEKPFKDIVATIKTMNDVSTYQQFFEEVLGSSLKYDEMFRRLLREGVVNAKYSLVNFETKPKYISKTIAGRFAAAMEDLDEVEDFPPPIPQIRPEIRQGGAARARLEAFADWRQGQEQAGGGVAVGQGAVDVFLAGGAGGPVDNAAVRQAREQQIRDAARNVFRPAPRARR